VFFWFQFSFHLDIDAISDWSLSAQPTQLLRTISETALYLAQHGTVKGRAAFFRRPTQLRVR
jgi:hypothetical protein